MSHLTSGKKTLMIRLRRIKGQVSALESLLESEPDCSKVLQQISAIRGATNGLMMQVLDSHIREHLLSGANSKAKQADLEEVMGILKTYLK